MTAETLAPVVRLTRRLPGTPEQVFDAWTDPAKFRHWMAPGTLVVARAEADLRVGGRFELVMQGAQGDYPHHGTYRELDRPRRIVFTWISPATGSLPSVVTIELAPTFGGTDLTLTHEQLAPDRVADHRRGWDGIGDKLDAWLRDGMPV